MTSTHAGFSRVFKLLALCAAATTVSCEGCDGGGGGGGISGGGGGSWLVGASGLMLNVTTTEPTQVDRYALRIPRDLLAIGCRGEQEAWVAGDGGTVLATADAGATWRMVDAGVTGALRAVSLASPGRVYVAGDHGVLRISADAGRTWLRADGPPVTWTSVAARRDGQGALLASAEGQLYRYTALGGALEPVGGIATGALYSVVLARDGRTAVAVGDGGALLVSTDGGLNWQARPSGTARSLRDVWLVGDDGGRFMAVGDGGTVIEGPTLSQEATVRSLGDGLTLRALHLEAGGHGTTVGDRGAVFVTHDFGVTWAPVATGEERALYGVDALEAGSHL